MISTLVLTAALAATPRVGDIAPDFTVKDVDGNTLELKSLVEKHTVILAFFPKAFTPGWTKEMTAYRDRYADIEKAGAKVIGISADDAETLRKFRDSLKSKDAFVSDKDLALIKRYDVKTPLLSMAQRTTFVVGKGMKIQAVISGSDAIDPENSVRACTLPSARDAGVSK